MDRNERYAKVDAWAIQNDFWKSDTSDWLEIFAPLLAKGFTFEEAQDIVESIIGLARSEYGE